MAKAFKEGCGSFLQALLYGFLNFLETAIVAVPKCVSLEPLPQPLHWVQFWGMGWQIDELNVFWHTQTFRNVPTGLVQPKDIGVLITS